jgi:hypothetical protein
MADMEKKNGKCPEGQFVGMWMGIGIAIFTGIGVSLSVALKMPGLIGIGPAIGVAFGAAIGHSIESKYKKAGKIRPLTEGEKWKGKILVFAGISIFIIGLLLFLLKLFS